MLKVTLFMKCFHDLTQCEFNKHKIINNFIKPVSLLVSSGKEFICIKYLIAKENH